MNNEERAYIEKMIADLVRQRDEARAEAESRLNEFVRVNDALTEAESERDEARKQWSRECDDGDRIIARFCPGVGRTDGGSLRVDRIIAALDFAEESQRKAERERDEARQLFNKEYNEANESRRMLRAELSSERDQRKRQEERAERAERERDALRQDAERYRWLRNRAVYGPFNRYNAEYAWFDVSAQHEPGFDSTIDAAMKEKP